MTCNGWTLKIGRGSTLRVPVKVTDKQGVPITYLDTSFEITTDEGDLITYDPGNGKLLMPSFVWQADWGIGTNYVAGDVVYHYVKDKASYWKALQSSVAVIPGALNSAPFWEPFHQFLFLVPDTETAAYEWSSGTYSWMMQEGNGDVNHQSGNVEVTG